MCRNSQWEKIPSQPTRGGFGAPKEKHSIRMRGLPFSAKDKDITDFFTPLVPLKVNIDFDHYGRPSGEAEVQFSSHEDAMAAMQKNNDHMGKLCTVCVLGCVHTQCRLSY